MAVDRLSVAGSGVACAGRVLYFEPEQLCVEEGSRIFSAKTHVESGRLQGAPELPYSDKKKLYH